MGTYADNLYVETTVIGNGFWALFCYKRNWHGPLAVVWGWMKVNNGKRVFITYDSYTTVTQRRKGFRAAINKRLFEVENADAIITGTGTEDGGRAFLDASGYVIDKRTGDFILTKSKFKSIQRAKQKEDKDNAARPKD